MPHALRRVGTDDETLAGLGVLVGYDATWLPKAPACPTGCGTLLHVHQRWNVCWASALNAAG